MGLIVRNRIPYTTFIKENKKIKREKNTTRNQCPYKIYKYITKETEDLKHSILNVLRYKCFIRYKCFKIESLRKG